MPKKPWKPPLVERDDDGDKKETTDSFLLIIMPARRKRRPRRRRKKQVQRGGNIDQMIRAAGLGGLAKPLKYLDKQIHKVHRRLGRR